jgi:hypothetical protein
MKKDMVLCRSGVYKYTYDEMVARGHTPKTVKPIYTEYRPAEAIVHSKDKFELVTMSVEHTTEETTSANFHSPGQVSGAIGDNIRVEKLADGETALVAKVAFYTQDAVDYYNAGCRETSADYESRVVDGEGTPYDFVMKEIATVNNVVITKRGRGGEQVRVRDSLPPLIKKLNGGSSMDMWSFIPGLKRTKDNSGEFKLSKVIMDGVKEVQKADRTKDSGKQYLDAVEAGVGKVTPFLDQLKDSDEKKILTSIVHDSFTGEPAEVLLNEAPITEAVDKLYDTARARDSEQLKKTLDTVLGKKDETAEEKATRMAKEDKEKGSKPEDLANQVKDSVGAMLTDFQKNLPVMVAQSVAATLGLDPKAIEAAKARTTDKAPETLEESIKAQVAAMLGGKPGEGSADNRTLDDADKLASAEEGAFLVGTW